MLIISRDPKQGVIFRDEKGKIIAFVLYDSKTSKNQIKLLVGASENIRIVRDEIVAQEHFNISREKFKTLNDVQVKEFYDKVIDETRS